MATPKKDCQGEPTMDDCLFPGFILIECGECGMSDLIAKT